MLFKSLRLILASLFVYALFQAHLTKDPLSICLAAYALGSIPFGLILTQLFAGVDVRRIGSGNIGATNVLRSGHKGLAASTLLLDALKGAAAIMLASHYTSPDLTQALVLCAGGIVILGHIYPLWLNFQGGKGIATILGVLVTLSWPVALCCILAWIIVAKITRYSSLAGLTATGLAPLLGFFLEGTHFALFLLMLAIIICLRHIDNIKRLLQGKESRIGDPR